MGERWVRSTPQAPCLPQLQRLERAAAAEFSQRASYTLFCYTWSSRVEKVGKKAPFPVPVGHSLQKVKLAGIDEEIALLNARRATLDPPKAQEDLQESAELDE